MEIKELRKEYVIIDNEKIWFDEPFDDVPSKEDFVKWLKTIKKVLEKSFAVKNK